MVRCRVAATRDIVAVFVLVLMVGVMVYWHLRGTCTPGVSTQPCRIERIYMNQISSLNRDESEEPFVHTPVYVVEEHHEVLKYWFQAGERGLIPKQGNVLFHIDGHSDGAEPEKSGILTFFKWPTPKQISAMMQRNDQFIYGAALTGFISRYIWVWPPWDIEEPAFSDHTVKPMEMGTMMRLGLDGEMTLDFCTCLPEGIREDTEGFCFIKNLTDPNYEYGPLPVEREECNIQNKGIVEVVSEDKALDLLYKGNWITPLDNVILDVDEDYYGVEAAIQPLLDVGIKDEVLVWLSFYVSKLFCSKDAFQERESDKFYNAILKKVINLKRYCKQWGQSASNQCSGHPAMTSTLFQILSKMLEDRKELHPALCSENESKHSKILNAIIRHAVKYTEPQLMALVQVGICHTMSVKSYNFNSSLGMKVCDGYNKPNASIIPFHMPTMEEIDYRTAMVREIFKDPSLAPKVITVCRSVRDGYTPRSHFRQIEQGILKALGDFIKGVDKDSVYYDPDLLGGRLGWHDRH